VNSVVKVATMTTMSSTLAEYQVSTASILNTDVDGGNDSSTLSHTHAPTTDDSACTPTELSTTFSPTDASTTTALY